MTPVEALVILSLQWVPCPATETPEQCAAHREDIATDALAIAATDPLPKRGAEGTAVLIMATASLESRFNETAVSRTGDHCVMQVKPIGAESVDTRLDCMRVALGRMHWSWDVCSHKSKDWLGPYKSGKCWGTQKDARINLARAASGWERFKALTRPRATP